MADAGGDHQAGARDRGDDALGLHGRGRLVLIANPTIASVGAVMRAKSSSTGAHSMTPLVARDAAVQR